MRKKRVRTPRSFTNCLRTFEFLYDYNDALRQSPRDRHHFSSNKTFWRWHSQIEYAGGFFYHEAEHVMVVDPESTQLEETQATVLRRIHDIGIDDDSSKPATRRYALRCSDDDLNPRWAKFEKWNQWNITNPSSPALRLPTPPIIKEWSLAQQLIQKEETAASPQLHGAGNNRTRNGSRNGIPTSPFAS
jgi:hypothetical protein